MGLYVKDIFKEKSPVLSMEIFPPKPDYPIDTIYNTLDNLKNLNPDYISVTYGAGGSNSKRTVEIASKIINDYSIETLAHLTCVCSFKADIDKILKEMKKNNIHNVLALRGDVPKGCSTKDAFINYKHASDLISQIAKKDFCIGAAAYPEGHINNLNIEEDIEYLKLKVQKGADFLVTQMFFDNDKFYSFMDKIKQKNINVPITTGIMPVLNVNQIIRMTIMSGASIPSKLSKLFAKYQNPEDLEKAGLEYAMNQIKELIDFGVNGIHLYTMNKYKQIEKIVKGINLR